MHKVTNHNVMETSHPTCNVRDFDADSIANHDHTLSATLARRSPSCISETRPASELLSDRLARVALLRSEDVPLPEEESITLSRCVDRLDTIESILDPRPELMHEISKCRPRNICIEKANTATADRPTAPPIRADNVIPPVKQASLKNLTAVLNEVTALGDEFDRRREESFQIYGLLTREFQRMTRKISELEHDVHELQMDIEEEAAEREGLQGTVHGLISWVESWQEQRELAASTSRSQKSGRRRWTRRKDEGHNADDSEALLEGIHAWSRGWRDAEEEFRVRERERKLRREDRQKSRVNAGENVEVNEQGQRQ